MQKFKKGDKVKLKKTSYFYNHWNEIGNEFTFLKQNHYSIIWHDKRKSDFGFNEEDLELVEKIGHPQTKLFK